MMNKQEMRERKAMEARAWINGGSVPYQTARHCGFKTVGDMYAAIKELDLKQAGGQDDQEEKQETEQLTQKPADEEKVTQEDAQSGTIEPPVGRVYSQRSAYKQPFRTEAEAAKEPMRILPDNKIAMRDYTVEYFRAQNGHNEMVRLRFSGGRKGWLNMKRGDLLKVANLLNMMHDLLEEEEISEGNSEKRD